VSNQDIEGRVPPESAPDAGSKPSGPPDSLERQLAKEREARQLIRDRLRHTEALAAESHALRAQMAEELERVTADRDRLRAEATIAAAVSVPDPAAPPAAAAEPAPTFATPPLGSARAMPGPRSARGAEPTLSPMPPPRPSGDHAVGERPLKPPARRGPWRALAMLGGLAAAVAGLAWLTGTMPSGTDVASLPLAASSPALGAAPAASASLASTGRPGTPAASHAIATAAPASTPVAAAAAPHGPVPLPPLTPSPETQLAAAPTAAGPAPATPVPASAAVPAPVQADVRAQSQLKADGGLDVRLRKALDGEGITSIVEVDPKTGHVLVADPQADRTLRDRTDMLIRAVYAGASLPEPQIEHRWMSPMHGDRPAQQAQAGAQAPAGTSASPSAQTPNDARRPGLAAAQALDLAPPAAGLATKHVEAARVGDRRKASLGNTVADAEELRPVVPAGRVTAGCMEDLTGRTSNRRAALTACMKHSCCSSSGNLNSEECRAYQKAYPYTCGAG